MSQGEFDLIHQYFRQRVPARPNLPLGIGDDGAVVRPDERDLVWVLDTINAGVHFPDGAPGRAVGHRVLAVNLSDMVAMGADPHWCLLSLTLPTPDGAWLEGFCEGFFGLCEQSGTTLAGGDLTRGPLAASVTLLGPLHARAVTRQGARPGDHLLVSGTLGDARAGLDIALGGGGAADAVEAWLLDRYLYPAPRLALAPLLPEYANAAIDLSDGLCPDLGHVLEESGVGAEIHLDRLPLSEALMAHAGEEAGHLALAGGDDYEILASVPPAQRDGFVAAAREAGVVLSDIGRVTMTGGIRVLDASGVAVPLPDGFSHFGETDA